MQEQTTKDLESERYEPWLPMLSTALLYRDDLRKPKDQWMVIWSHKVPAVLSGQALPQKYKRVAGRFAVL